MQAVGGGSVPENAFVGSWCQCNVCTALATGPHIREDGC